MHQHVHFIQNGSIHEFSSIAIAHSPMASMYMSKEMQSGSDILNHFGQLFATQMRRIRPCLIEYAKRWSVSHQHVCLQRDFVPMPAYRFAALYVECPVIERRLYRRSPER